MSDDIIGLLQVPHHDENGKTVYDIPTDWSEADLRAYHQVALREVKAIDTKHGANLTREAADRRILLRGYMAALKAAVEAIIAAQTIDDESIDELPTRPAVKEPSAAERVQVDEVIAAPVEAEAGLRFEGAEILDGHGNRYVRVTDSLDAQAAAVGAEEVAAMAASLRPKSNVPAVLAAEPTDAEVEAQIAQTAPLMAALGSFNQGQDRAGDQISAAQAGHLLLQTASRRVQSPSTVYLFRQDKLAPLMASLGVERLDGTGGSPDRGILDLQARHAEALLAAFCGPGELNRDQRVAVNTTRPVAAALAQANSPIAIGLGTHEFFRAIGLANLHAHYAANPSAPKGLGIWNSVNQDAVDVADPTTWKGCFTLPACPTTVQVAAYFLWRCMTVNIEDQMSRPQQIQNYTLLMEAMLARTAEGALLNGMDAWSIQRTVPNTPGYGAMAQLFWGVEQVMAWATSGNRVSRRGYTLVVPEVFINLARIDAYFAGEDPAGVMNRMEDITEGNVLVTPDWGQEGNPMLPTPVLPDPEHPAASNGTAIPLLPSTYVLRMVPLEDFQWGSTGVVDYGIETSPDLRRQNKAMFFGESAEIFYKTGGRPSYQLTLLDVVPNGARADKVAPFSAPNPRTSYNNSLPKLAPAGLTAQQFSEPVNTIPGS